MRNLWRGKGACGRVAALNGACRRGVVLHLVVDLQPVALRVRHDDPTVLLVKDDGRGVGEAPFALQAAHFAPPFHRVRAGCQRHLGPFGEFLGIAHQTGDNLAIRGEDLHAMVRPVTHIHITLRVDSHVGGTIQLALAGPITATKLHDERTIGGELLHAVILMVGNVDVTLLVYSDTPRRVELTLGATKAAPRGQELAVRGEFLHTVVAAVNDIQDILLVYSDPRGTIELTVTAPRRAPATQEGAVLIEDGDAVEPLVGDVHIFLAIQRDAGGPDHFPRCLARAGEIAHRLLIARYRSDGELSYAGP